MWGGIGMIYYVSYSYLINYPPNHTNFGMTPLPTPPYDAPWEGLGPGLRNFQDRVGPENCSPRLKGFAGGGGFFERSAYIAFREKVHRCILEIKCIIMRAQPILANVLYTILGTSGVCVAWGVGVFQWARGGWWVSHGCVFFSIFRERGCRVIGFFWVVGV